MISVGVLLLATPENASQVVSVNQDEGSDCGRLGHLAVFGDCQEYAVHGVEDGVVGHCLRVLVLCY